METKAIEIKAAITAAVTAVSAILGVKGTLIVVWMACMILDYVSGYIAAKANNEWKSEKARTGAWHKTGMVMIVAAAALVDIVLLMACEQFPELGIEWKATAMPFMLLWYIITEIGSIFENAAKMGAPVPAWLTTGMKVGLKAIEKKIGNSEEKEE